MCFSLRERWGNPEGGVERRGLDRGDRGKEPAREAGTSQVSVLLHARDADGGFYKESCCTISLLKGCHNKYHQLGISRVGSF